jgi:alpha-aminoadipate/glutamate carrier protein LysW
MMAKCKECDGDMKINDDVIVGEIISCSECGSDYEIASLDGGVVAIKEAESVKEDWGE